MSFLYNVYKSVPAVPSLVYLARKMNLMEGLDDTPGNGVKSMIEILQVLLEENFETLEEAHFKNLSSVERPEVPAFLKEKADKVHAQLALINELDKKLATSLNGLEERISRAKQALAEEGSLSATLPTLPTESLDFESLFKDQPLVLPQQEEELDEAVQLELNDVPAPPPLRRSVAIS